MLLLTQVERTRGPRVLAGQRGHQQLAPLLRIQAPDLAVVRELDCDLRPERVHVLGQRREARKERVVRDADLVRRVRAPGIRGRGLPIQINSLTLCFPFPLLYSTQPSCPCSLQEAPWISMPSRDAFP